MLKLCSSELFYQLHDGSWNDRVIIHACGSYQKLLLRSCWVMQKYLQATSVVQKDLLLLWLRLSQTCNLGLHFGKGSWMKEGEAEVCVVERAVEGMWSNGPGRKGRKGWVKGSPIRAQVLFVWFAALCPMLSLVPSPWSLWTKRELREVCVMVLYLLHPYQWPRPYFIHVNRQIKVPHIDILEPVY